MHHLMRLLSTTRRDAVGLLELLWEYTCDFAPRGNIGRWPNEDIAQAVEWQANPDELIIALTDAGWLDKSDDHRLVVHDWHDHAPEYIKKRLSRAGIAFVRQRQTTADNGGQCLPTEAGQALPSQAQPRQGKPAGDAKKPASPKDPFPLLLSAAFNNNGTAKQQAVFRPVVETALALGATPGLLLSRLNPRPDDPFAAVRQAGKDVKAMLKEFGKLLHIKCDLKQAIGVSFDPDVPDGMAKQQDLDALRKKHAKLLAELKRTEPDHA